jgi:acyl-CoA thioesterase-1
VRRNLEQIIETAQARGVAVLLCGMDALPLYGWQYTLDFHRVFPALAEKYGVPLVPFLLASVAQNPALIQEDGLHPTAQAQPRILDNVWSKLAPLLDEIPAE